MDTRVNFSSDKYCINAGAIFDEYRAFRYCRYIAESYLHYTTLANGNLIYAHSIQYQYHFYLFLDGRRIISTFTERPNLI